MTATSSTTADSELTWLRRNKKLRISSEDDLESQAKSSNQEKGKRLKMIAEEGEEVEVETDREIEMIEMTGEERGIEILPEKEREVVVEIGQVTVEAQKETRVKEGKEKEKMIEVGDAETVLRRSKDSKARAVAQAVHLLQRVDTAVEVQSLVTLKPTSKMLHERAT